MPRRKPDTVNVTRIELGPWEREHLGPAIQAQASKPYLEFVGSLMRDVSAIALIAGFLTLLLPGWLPADWRDTLGMSEDPAGLRATLEDWFELQNIAGGLAGAWAGGTVGSVIPGFGTIIGAILGFITGSFAVEVGEAGIEALQDAQAEMALGFAAMDQKASEIRWTAILVKIIMTLESVGLAQNE